MKNKNNQKKTKSHTLSLNTASKSKNIPVLVRVGDTVYVDFVPKEIAKVQLEKSEKKERLTTDKTQTGINSLEFELRTIKKFKTFKSMMKELNELNRKYKKEKTKGNITISLPIRGNL